MRYGLAFVVAALLCLGQSCPGPTTSGPTTSDEDVTIPEGTYSGSGSVRIVDTENATLVGDTTVQLSEENLAPMTFNSDGILMFADGSRPVAVGATQTVSTEDAATDTTYTEVTLFDGGLTVKANVRMTSSDGEGGYVVMTGSATWDYTLNEDKTLSVVEHLQLSGTIDNSIMVRTQDATYTMTLQEEEEEASV